MHNLTMVNYIKTHVRGTAQINDASYTNMEYLNVDVLHHLHIQIAIKYNAIKTPLQTKCGKHTQLFGMSAIGRIPSTNNSRS